MGVDWGLGVARAGEVVFQGPYLLKSCCCSGIFMGAWWTWVEEAGAVLMITTAYGPLYVVWATVCVMGHSVCYGPLCVLWATVCVMGHCVCYGPLCVYIMGHCVCYGPLGVKWATLCVMGHCMFYGPLGVLGSPRNVVEWMLDWRRWVWMGVREW